MTITGTSHACLMHDLYALNVHSLLEVLSDHLNAETVAGTISSKQEAVDYMTWTYFFRRLIRNPRYCV